MDNIKLTVLFQTQMHMFQLSFRSNCNHQTSYRWEQHP